MRVMLFCVILVLCALLNACQAPATSRGPLQVGPNPHGGYTVATAQLIHPPGQSIEYKGRPIDLLLSPDRKTLSVKDSSQLLIIDTAAWTIRQQLKYPKGSSSMHGLACSSDGSRVYVTVAQSA